jgi:outer membrane protein TolC
MSRVRQSVAWLLLACCGCAVGPNFARPEAPTADRYGPDAIPSQLTAASGEDQQRVQLGQEIQGRWWSLFQSPELDALLERAIAGRTLAVRAPRSPRRAPRCGSARSLLPQVTCLGERRAPRKPRSNRSLARARSRISTDRRASAMRRRNSAGPPHVEGARRSGSARYELAVA